LLKRALLRASMADGRGSTRTIVFPDENLI
jgi:hypothetical protein